MLKRRSRISPERGINQEHCSAARKRHHTQTNNQCRIMRYICAATYDICLKIYSDIVGGGRYAAVVGPESPVVAMTQAFNRRVNLIGTVHASSTQRGVMTGDTS